MLVLVQHIKEKKHCGLTSLVHLTISACVNLSSNVVPDWCGAGLPGRLSPSVVLPPAPHDTAASTAAQSPNTTYTTREQIIVSNN